MKAPKIYTRTGDDGTTSLYSGERVEKASKRINAIGAIDELNSFLGICATHAESENELQKKLESIQNKLFDLGAELSATKDHYGKIKETTDLDWKKLEKEMDEMTENLSELKTFILPGGTRLSAHLHAARSICRRVEREVASAMEKEKINKEIPAYLNRLSDWLFVAARQANANAKIKDVEWKKGSEKVKT